jgi:predicted negative regulator of RcsB-dependent stress response
MKRNRRMYRENIGFQKVEILEGNIGYVDFRYFGPLESGRAASSSAMRFIENADAVIFDMRKNGGGNPSMVQYVCSYFFDKPTYLNSLYWRRGDRTQEFWTLDDVDGRKRPDVPVFILTSSRTFSGAEEFCYNFQTRNRATLIGEITGGGANPGGTFPINDNFRIFIPTGKAVNPVTGTNWEGVGVKPDIETDAESALDVALEKAREAAEAFREKELDRMKGVTKALDQAAGLFSGDNMEGGENRINEALEMALKNRFADEATINQLGYSFLGGDQLKMAVAVFRFNAIRFPRSSNAYDSLGEAYKKSGNREQAVKNYKKSLELDPGNENAKQMLAEMGIKL